MEPELRGAFLTELYRHGCHLEYNLSHYFSPNTHLLGEAVALHAIGTLFPEFPRAAKWQRIGATVVREELSRQVRPDGSHFEQSTYYHVYALDFFVLHYILSGKPADFRSTLASMAEYLDAVMGPQRRIPLIGDDDGGRLFFPRGRHDQFGRATLATCAVLFDRSEWLTETEDIEEQAVWWLGPVKITRPVIAHRESQVFAGSGSVVMAAGEFWMLVNVGGFGPFRAGHSHSHVLSFVARFGDQDILIDPGTYTYMSDPKWRNWFRGSIAHNTVRVNGMDQAVPAGPFAWNGKPRVTLESWQSTAQEDRLVASCKYGEITHRRHIVFFKPSVVLILDEIHAPGEFDVEQMWHPGESSSALSATSFRVGGRVILSTTSEAKLFTGENFGWRSRAYGQKEASPAVVVSSHARATAFVGAALYEGPPDSIVMSQQDSQVLLEMPGNGLRALFRMPSPGGSDDALKR